MIRHGFSRQIMRKCGTKYKNENYILGHPKWKWELYFTPSVSKYKSFKVFSHKLRI